jgi:hypothetical protein
MLCLFLSHVYTQECAAEFGEGGESCCLPAGDSLTLVVDRQRLTDARAKGLSSRTAVDAPGVCVGVGVGGVCKRVYASMCFACHCNGVLDCWTEE